MKNLLLACLLAAVGSLHSQTFSGPESVDCDTLTNNWYVGNKGNGQILRRTPDATWTTFVSGLSNGPYGIEVVGDRLYACVGNQIRGFNLSNGAAVFTANTTGTFLNGLTHDDAGFLYSTDFSGKKIYKINTANATATVFVSALSVTPNGIIFEPSENRLVFATWGTNAKIMAVSMADSSVTTLKTTTFSNIDGITQDRQGRFYVAHWGANSVHRFDHDFAPAAVAVATGLSSPADIFYNTQTDTLGIPNSGNNTVKFIGFTPISPSLEPSETLSLRVFPNPTTAFLTIFMQSKTEVPQVTDQEGRRVNCPSQPIEDGWKLDVRGLPAGIYSVSLRQLGRVVSGQFVRG